MTGLDPAFLFVRPHVVKSYLMSWLDFYTLFIYLFFLLVLLMMYLESIRDQSSLVLHRLPQFGGRTNAQYFRCLTHSRYTSFYDEESKEILHFTLSQFHHWDYFIFKTSLQTTVTLKRITLGADGKKRAKQTKMSLCSFIIILHQQYALILIMILLLYWNIASHFSLTNFQFHYLLLFLYSFFPFLSLFPFSGVTILLSLTVFLNLVAETLPQVSDAIPLLGRRINGSFFLCLLYQCTFLFPFLKKHMF